MQTNNQIRQDKSDGNLVLKINQANVNAESSSRVDLNKNNKNELDPMVPKPIITNPTTQPLQSNANLVANQYSPQNPSVIINPNPITTIIFDPNQLKNESVNVMCPYCKKSVMTNAVRRCDCVNLLCCLCSFSSCFITYCCFQCCRGKPISCYSASHYCPMCGGFLREYLAC